MTACRRHSFTSRRGVEIPTWAALSATHASNEEVMSYARTQISAAGRGEGVSDPRSKGSSGPADAVENGAAPMERLPPVLWVAVWGVIERGVSAALADERYEVGKKISGPLITTPHLYLPPPGARKDAHTAARALLRGLRPHS